MTNLVLSLAPKYCASKELSRRVSKRQRLEERFGRHFYFLRG